MRPSIDVRARRAVPALGAICLATTLIVVPSAARSDPARAADVSTVHSRLNVIAGGRASVTGRTRAAIAGRPVVLQRRAGHHWLTVARATTRAGGAFTLRFRPRKPASSRLRLLVDSTRREIGRLNVYRRTSVSWYGPGLYGNKLSCGGRLTPGTLGVAHKTLPCGTRVTLRRGNRVVRVPVVDRGPYVGGREFDLTAATRARLGFGGVGSVLVAS
ncbi:MAG: rare lipoprotein [Solirubrobacteraceae bacterium]